MSKEKKLNKYKNSHWLLLFTHFYPHCGVFSWSFLLLLLLWIKFGERHKRTLWRQMSGQGRRRKNKKIKIKEGGEAKGEIDWKGRSNPPMERKGGGFRRGWRAEERAGCWNGEEQKWWLKGQNISEGLQMFLKYLQWGKFWIISGSCLILNISE